MITREIQKSQGRKSVQSGIQKMLAEEPKVLDKFFETKHIPLQVRNQETKDIEIKQKEITFCSDIPGFTNYLKEKRDIQGDIDTKIGIDGGQNFFKVTMNITEKRGSATDITSPPKKRSKFKDGGVKKLEILAIVEGVIETYEKIEKYS